MPRNSYVNAAELCTTGTALELSVQEAEDHLRTNGWKRGHARTFAASFNETQLLTVHELDTSSDN